MFDLGWTEMVIIGVVALIVVGPKELPGLFRAVGQMVGKARGMAREFSRAMEAAADEAGVKEIDRTIRVATRPMQYGADRLREAALGDRPGRTRSAAPVPPAGTPIEGGRPAPSAGTATSALAQQRAEERARRLEEAAARGAARPPPAAPVQAAQAPAPAPAAPATPPATPKDETAA